MVNTVDRALVRVGLAFGPLQHRVSVYYIVYIYVASVFSHGRKTKQHTDTERMRR